MQIEIITEQSVFTVFGFSGIAPDKEYTKTAFALMDQVWKLVRERKIENKGLNTWIYEENEKVFAGVELLNAANSDTGLEQKTVALSRYALYKHIGPYHLIKQTGLAMRNEILKKGFDIIPPYIEIYGHWTNDENSLETTLIMALK